MANTWEPKHNDPVTIENVEAYYETEKAIKIRALGPATAECPDGWKQEIWIPKSQIHDDSEVWQNGQTGKLIIPEWLAIRAGLI